MAARREGQAEDPPSLEASPRQARTTGAENPPRVPPGRGTDAADEGEDDDEDEDD